MAATILKWVELAARLGAALTRGQQKRARGRCSLRCPNARSKKDRAELIIVAAAPGERDAADAAMASVSEDAGEKKV